MTARIPLYAKILLWFFLNLLLLALVAFVVMRGQFSFGLDGLISGRAGDRVQAVADLFAAELRATTRGEWGEIIARFSEAYDVAFHLCRPDGGRVLGPEGPLPPEVNQRLVDRSTVGRGRPFEQTPMPGRPGFRGPPPDGGPRPGEFTPRPREDERRDLPRRPGEVGTRPGDSAERSRSNGPAPAEAESRPIDPKSRQPEGFPRRPDGANPPPFAPQTIQGPPQFPGPPGAGQKFMVRAGEPPRYWVGVRLPFFDREPARPGPLTLVIESESIRGGGLFFDFIPLIWGGAAAVGLSVLLWFPFVRGITRTVAQMNAATARIAEGQFDASVPATRRDELGSLAAGVNQMAARLGGFVAGQRRFLGDIAHELCAPIARIQLSLGILEQRADERSKESVADLREEVQHMAGLVNELLSFSKASLGAPAIKLEPVNLRDAVERAIRRESRDGITIASDVPADCRVHADAELLVRALSNLLRNAVRHAGHAGPISINATVRDGVVELTVADNGPGVPPEALPKLFDPFFRVDESRTRDTGGVGLGLTIVKTCVESCGGTVTCRNREPSGLEVCLRLKPA